MLKSALRNASRINARKLLKSHLVSFPKPLELPNYKQISFNSIQNKIFFNFSSDEPPKGNLILKIFLVFLSFNL